MQRNKLFIVQVDKDLSRQKTLLLQGENFVHKVLFMTLKFETFVSAYDNTFCFESIIM